MNLRNILLAAATGLLATAAFAADSSFERALTVSSNPQLSVYTGSGFIHVSPGSDSEVHIMAHVHANRGWFDNHDVDARIQQIVANPPIQQNGNIVIIGSHDHNDNSLFRNISIDYDIKTPKSTTLKADTGSGDLRISDIDGTVSAESGSGNVDIHNIGPNARLGSGSGNIRADGIRGGASLETGSGDIELRQQAAGDVKAQTGSGSIHIHEFHGGLRAGTGSGDITVDGMPSADWRLDTGSGSVHLNVGSSARFALNAETGSGSVHVEQPLTMQGSINKHHIMGTVNGGGPTIKAETGSGDITIQ